MKALMAALAACALFAAPPAFAQRLLSPFHPHAASRPHPNGPPSPAVQMQQGHKPSVAVQMQQRIPESQRQPIVQQRYPSRNGVANRPHGHWRGAP